MKLLFCVEQQGLRDRVVMKQGPDDFELKQIQQQRVWFDRCRPLHLDHHQGRSTMVPYTQSAHRVNSASQKNDDNKQRLSADTTPSLCALQTLGMRQPGLAAFVHLEVVFEMEAAGIRLVLAKGGLSSSSTMTSNYRMSCSAFRDGRPVKLCAFRVFGFRYSLPVSFEVFLWFHSP